MEPQLMNSKSNKQLKTPQHNNFMGISEQPCASQLEISRCHLLNKSVHIISNCHLKNSKPETSHNTKRVGFLFEGQFLLQNTSVLCMKLHFTCTSISHAVAVYMHWCFTCTGIFHMHGTGVSIVSAFLWYQHFSSIQRFKCNGISCFFVCNREDTIQYQGSLRSRELGQAPMLHVFLTPRQALSSHPHQQMV